jgi:hypothetical protein
LLASPAKTNVCCPAELLEVAPVGLKADELEGRNNIQGIATSLPALEESLEEVADEVDDGVVEVVLGRELLDELEITAKSILPEDGLSRISLIVPKVSPWLLFTSEFISWLALVSCPPMRPAPKRLVLSKLEDPDGLVD